MFTLKPTKNFEADYLKLERRFYQLFTRRFSNRSTLIRLRVLFFDLLRCESASIRPEEALRDFCANLMASQAERDLLLQLKHALCVEKPGRRSTTWLLDVFEHVLNWYSKRKETMIAFQGEIFLASGKSNFRFINLKLFKNFERDGEPGVLFCFGLTLGNLSEPVNLALVSNATPSQAISNFSFVPTPDLRIVDSLELFVPNRELIGCKSKSITLMLQDLKGTVLCSKSLDLNIPATGYQRGFGRISPSVDAYDFISGSEVLSFSAEYRPKSLFRGARISCIFDLKVVSPSSKRVELSLRVLDSAGRVCHFLRDPGERFVLRRTLRLSPPVLVARSVVWEVPLSSIDLTGVDPARMFLELSVYADNSSLFLANICEVLFPLKDRSLSSAVVMNSELAQLVQ